MSTEELIRTAQRRGLNIIAVTDHNTIKGAREAKKKNTYPDLKIIIGCEKKCEYGELLIYNLKKEIKSDKFKNIIKEARKQKALVFIAHPTDYIRFNNAWKKLSKDYLQSVDGIEVYNGRNVFNNLSRKLYNKEGLKGVAGSDAHYAEEIGNTYVEYNKNLWKEIKERKARFVHENSLIKKFKFLIKSFINKWL
jgi:predicted metal-dependent phosphoesterase TrpH